jgi:hypothetical protein
MTSIEWLINEIDMQYPLLKIRNKEWMIDKAKEMHKQEIIDAANKLLYHGPGPGNTAAEQYYQETFVSKGNDDTLKDYHIVESNEMVEIPKQEISDEEIEKAARDYDSNVIYGPPLVHFEQGTFWYREQLKSIKQTKKD